MAAANDHIRLIRVGPHSPEAEYWSRQLREIAPPSSLNMTKERPSVPMPQDAIVLVAEDISTTESNGQAKAIGSVAIKGLLPGTEPSKSLATDIQFGEIKRMVVLPTYQGTGVAARLLKAAEEAGKNELGLQCILIETAHALKQARRFYEKNGYQDRAIWGLYHKEDSVGLEKWV